MQAAARVLTVTVTPPQDVEKGDYTIPISAISAEDSLSQDLSVSITGTYERFPFHTGWTSEFGCICR